MIRWLFFVAGLVLLVLVFRQAGPGKICADVSSQGWVLLPFILLSAVESGLHSLSCLWCVAPPFRREIRWGRMFLLYNLSYAINLVTPTGDVGGDVARGMAMRQHMPMAEAASSILVNKVTFSVTRIVLAAALSSALIVALPVDSRSVWIIGAGSALTLTGLLLFGVFQVRGLLGPTLVRLARLAGPRRQAWMKAHAAELDEALGSFYRNHRRDLSISVLYDMLGFLVGIVQRCLLLGALLGFRALPFPRLLAAGAGIWGISNLVDMVFFFVMGRLGIREGGYQAAFEAVGLPGPKGLAMSVVDRVDQLVWTLLGLGVYWAYVLRPGSKRPIPEHPSPPPAGPGPRPPERLLIVTGDDFGMSPSVNRAIVRAHREGILTSASLLVNGESADEAIQMARETPSLAVGLHLALSLSKSTLPPDEIPGLVDRERRFLDSPSRAGFRYFFRRGAAREIEKEVRAQFEKFLSTGIRMDHVDGHQHLHLHPTVFPIVARACAEYGVPGIRILRESLLDHLRVDRSGILRKAALSAVFTLLGKRARRLLRDLPVRSPDQVLGLLQDGRMDGSALRTALASIGAGFTEVYCHPSLSEDADSGRYRRLEFEALIDIQTLRLLESGGIRRVSYSELDSVLLSPRGAPAGLLDLEERPPAPA